MSFIEYNVETNIKEGTFAKWPYTDGYVEPRKTGYLFKAWKFNGNEINVPLPSEENNAFGPINENTNIYAVWEKVEINATTNREVIDYIGDEDLGDLTEFNYWVSSFSGQMITENIEIEDVELGQDELPIVFNQEYEREYLDEGKKVKQVCVVENDCYEDRYYRFKVVTTQDSPFHPMETEVLELRQNRRPDEYFLEYTQGQGDTKVIERRDATTIYFSVDSVKNGVFFNELTFICNEDWITPTGVVQQTGQKTANIEGEVSALPEELWETGRTATITIIQNGSGNTLQIEVHQISETIAE